MVGITLVAVIGAVGCGNRESRSVGSWQGDEIRHPACASLTVKHTVGMEPTRLDWTEKDGGKLSGYQQAKTFELAGTRDEVCRAIVAMCANIGGGKR